MGTPEKQVENSILAYLELLTGCFAWKNQSVGIYDPTKKTFRKAMSKYSINGVSDVLGIYNGKMLAIEVKTPETIKTILKNYEELKNYRGLDKSKNRINSQIRFIEMIKKQGGIAFFAASIDDVKKGLHG